MSRNICNWKNLVTKILHLSDRIFYDLLLMTTERILRRKSLLGLLPSSILKCYWYVFLFVPLYYFSSSLRPSIMFSSPYYVIKHPTCPISNLSWKIRQILQVHWQLPSFNWSITWSSEITFFFFPTVFLLCACSFYKRSLFRHISKTRCVSRSIIQIESGNKDQSIGKSRHLQVLTTTSSSQSHTRARHKLSMRFSTLCLCTSRLYLILVILHMFSDFIFTLSQWQVKNRIEPLFWRTALEFLAYSPISGPVFLCQLICFLVSFHMHVPLLIISMKICLSLKILYRKIFKKVKSIIPLFRKVSPIISSEGRKRDQSRSTDAIDEDEKMQIWELTTVSKRTGHQMYLAEADATCTKGSRDDFCTSWGVRVVVREKWITTVKTGQCTWKRMGNCTNPGRISQGDFQIFAMYFWHSDDWTLLNEAFMEAVMIYPRSSSNSQLIAYDFIVES